MIRTRSSPSGQTSLQEPQPGDVIDRRYRVKRVLGVGGMGVVFVAENIRTGRDVALKWVPSAQAGEEGLARFVREARVAGKIEHPNVVDVYDVIEDGESMFLVMELLRGEPLSAMLMRERLLPVADASAIMIEALRGLAAVHEAGVIHRDLKPDNLFLCAGKGAGLKILDFGVSKPMGGDDLSLTRTGAIVGTPFYMAPEQMRGAKDLDARVDTYALGAILYQMLGGQMPFAAESIGALAIEVATGTPESLTVLRPELPKALVDVVRKGMARERSDRFIDAAAFARALEPFADGVAFDDSGADWTGRISTRTVAPVMSTSDPTALRSEIRPTAETHQSRIIAVVALVVVALAGVWWWSSNQNDPIDSPVVDEMVVDEMQRELVPRVDDPIAEPELPSEVQTGSEPEPESDEDRGVAAATSMDTPEIEAPSRASMRSRMQRTMRAPSEPQHMEHRAGDITLDDF